MKRRWTPHAAALCLAVVVAQFACVPAWADATTSVTLQYANTVSTEDTNHQTDALENDASPFPRTGDASGIFAVVALMGVLGAGSVLGASLIRRKRHEADTEIHKGSGVNKEEEWT